MGSQSTEQLFLSTYDQHADAIYRFCYFKLLNKEKAEEVSQEAFTRTWEYLADGKEVENLRAFVYRVAKNIMVDYFRKKKESSLDELRTRGFDVAVDLQEHWENQMDGSEIVKVIARLDEKFREVILLRYVNDLPVKEISKIIGETENHVSVRLHRGLKQLKEILGRKNVRKVVS